MWPVIYINLSVLSVTDCGTRDDQRVRLQEPCRIFFSKLATLSCRGVRPRSVMKCRHSSQTRQPVHLLFVYYSMCEIRSVIRFLTLNVMRGNAKPFSIQLWPVMKREYVAIVLVKKAVSTEASLSVVQKVQTLVVREKIIESVF